MPSMWGGESTCHWPVKVLRGTFSDTKKLKLRCRYASKRVRVEFAR